VGVVDILVLVGVVVLAVRGAYPRQVFDAAMGFDRWVLRVVAYALLLTPDYPPFRVDTGPEEPEAALTLP
jgi:hypothetical protein